MFKRRKPLSPLQHARELCWPSMGWGRAFKYTKLRIVRLSDSSQKIARGLAIGVAISFSPLLGTHFIQAALLCLVFRGNILAALIATFVGNPWTFPFIWWGSIEFGAFIMGFFGMTAGDLPADIDLKMLWEIITHHPTQIFLPWMIGGYILGLITAFPAYMISYYLVKSAKEARSRALLRDVHMVAQELTGQQT